ncbi:MAG: adenylate/guanylate cyclase domain-containing protein, partial [Alphaproteobacteria bacterium]
ERRAEGHPELDFGLGLHVGEVMYGNIGVPARVEFSVTGPAANEVARLENLTKETGNRVVVSARFSRHLDVDWRSLGAYRLRGVSGEQEVFAPPKAG